MGYAGNSHDSTIMKKHSFWKKQREHFYTWSRSYRGCRSPISWNWRFRFSNYEVNEALHTQLTDAQANYNYRHSSARIIVEETLGLLKGRFLTLLFTNESSIPTVACCILHRMHIVREITFKYEWILARKDIHLLDISEKDDDCWHRGKEFSSTCWCKRNLESPDASLWITNEKKKKSLLQVLTYTAEAIIEQYNILSFIAVTVRILLMKQCFHEIFMSPVEF